MGWGTVNQILPYDPGYSCSYNSGKKAEEVLYFVFVYFVRCGH